MNRILIYSVSFVGVKRKKYPYNRVNPHFWVNGAHRKKVTETVTFFVACFINRYKN